LVECGPKQIKIDEAPNGKCGCTCDPAKTMCAVGFKLEIDPTKVCLETIINNINITNLL
jgi:hypothetical protein